MMTDDFSERSEKSKIEAIIIEKFIISAIICEWQRF